MANDAPLLAMLYTLAENYTDLLVGNNSPQANAIAERSRHPQVGDLVFETSHRLGVRNADMAATLGVLLAIEHRPLYAVEEWDEATEGRPCPTEKMYVIRTIDGRRFSWTNASMRALPVCVRAAWEIAVAGGALGETRSASINERADSRFVASCHSGRMLPEVREWVRAQQEAE